MTEKANISSTQKNEALFSSAPVAQAVVKMALPCVMSQIIGVIYNIADAFFVGQLGDPCQLAATTISMPIFLIMNVLGSLFGIGGASFVSRNLGAGNRARARQGAAFCTLTDIVIAFAYGMFILAFGAGLLQHIGANADTGIFCEQYIFWTVSVGAIPTSLSMILSHLVRSDGYPTHAGAGIIGGAALNIFLDPIFIFVLGMGVEGAGFATMLSNTASMLFFIIVIVRRRKTIIISFSPADYKAGDGIAKEIITVGLPGSIMTLMAVLSNIFLNSIVASYSNEAIAGMSIAKKIDTLGYALAAGTTQGVIPLIGYNYAAKNGRRTLSIIKTAFLLSMLTAVAGFVFLFVCAVPLTRFFIDEPYTVAFGMHFLKIVSFACPFVTVTMMTVSTFQAIGEKKRPMFLSFLRKGVFDIPLMFILNAAAGVNGIAWSTTLADLFSMIVAVSLFIPLWKRLKRELSGPVQE